jgi:hypothetical protein
VAATSRNVSCVRRTSAFQFCGEGVCVFKHSNPIRPPCTFWRTGDDGVDLFGIERAVDHQRFGDGETTALRDQRAEDQDAKHALMRMEAAWRTLAHQQDILDCKRWKKPAG